MSNSTRRYIVGFNYDNILELDDTTIEGRQQFITDNEYLNKEFQRKLATWLDGQDLSDQVEDFDEPLMFPIISLRCTMEVANIIKQFPGVEFVRPDGISK
jgi:hypothetical protein